MAAHESPAVRTEAGLEHASGPGAHSEVAHGSHGELAHVEHEKPEDWGWHHEFTKGRQIAGWACVVILLVLLTATHYNHAGSLAIILTAAVIAAGLIMDRQRQKNQWRR